MAVPDVVVRGPRVLAAPRAALGAWRDYVTLNKPRIMSLLLLTAMCAMVAGAGGDPGLVP